MIHIGMLTGRPYQLGGATDEMVHFWAKCGAVDQQIFYASNLLGLRHRIMVLDLRRIARGQDMHPSVFGVLEHLRRRAGPVSTMTG